MVSPTKKAPAKSEDKTPVTKAKAAAETSAAAAKPVNTSNTMKKASFLKASKGAVSVKSPKGNKKKHHVHDMSFFVFNGCKDAHGVVFLVHGEGDLANSSWLNKVCDDVIRKEGGMHPIPVFDGTFYFGTTNGEKILNSAG